MPRILVIEDEADIAKTIIMPLETEGYSASHVPNGQAALERLGQGDLPQLILRHRAPQYHTKRRADARTEHVMKFTFAPLAAFAIALLWFEAPAHAEQPTREALESAQTDGFGVRRGRRRAEEEWLEPNRLRREEFDRRATTAAGARQSASSEETANTGTASSPGEGSGAVTSGSGSAGKNGPRAGKPGGGIVTELGPHATGDKSGSGHGRGRVARSGIVTGAGGLHHGGRAGGSGIVSAAGAAPAATGAPGRPAGAGIVTGAGTAVGPVSVGAGKPGAGIVTAAGGPPGQANAHGRGRGGKH